MPTTRASTSGRSATAQRIASFSPGTAGREADRMSSDYYGAQAGEIADEGRLAFGLEAGTIECPMCGVVTRCYVCGGCDCECGFGEEEERALVLDCPVRWRALDGRVAGNGV